MVLCTYVNTKKASQDIIIFLLIIWFVRRTIGDDSIIFVFLRT